MKVEKIEIDGILGLKMLLEGLGNVVKLSGRNGAGKSRAIACIMAVIKWSALPPEKVEEQVLKVLGLLEPLQELDERKKQTASERTVIGQRQRDVGFNPDAKKPEEVRKVSLVELSDKLKKANQNNQDLKDLTDRKEKATTRHTEVLELLNKLQTEKQDFNVLLSLQRPTPIPSRTGFTLKKAN